MNTTIKHPVLHHVFHFCKAAVISGTVILLTVSCATAPAAITAAPRHTPLTFVFTGDLMAHQVNFRQKSYGNQYAALEPLLKNSDASFTNLEFVIDNTKEYATYPRFNVQRPYVQAAIDAGFSVFSLANNHTADGKAGGIIQTGISAAEFKNAAQKNGKTLIFSGLKEPEDAPFIPEVFTVKNTRIVFLAVTELLNDHSSGTDRINLLEYTKKGREEFTAAVAHIKQTYAPDIFILSVHTAEPEYVRTVTALRKNYFRSLAEAGADIIWANHPHVPQPWEEYTAANGRRALIIYSLGNLISGQRYTPNLENPEAPREYTGDTVVLAVTLTPDTAATGAFAPCAIDVIPHLYTTYVNQNDETISLRPFTPEFIASCPPELHAYYQKRHALMHGYLPLPPRRITP